MYLTHSRPSISSFKISKWTRKNCNWPTAAPPLSPAHTQMLSKHLRRLSANPFSPQGQQQTDTQINWQLRSSELRQVREQRGNWCGATARQMECSFWWYLLCLLTSETLQTKVVAIFFSVSLPPFTSPSPLSFLYCSPSSRYESALVGLEGFTDGGKNWHSDSLLCLPITSSANDNNILLSDALHLTVSPPEHCASTLRQHRWLLVAFLA